MAFARRKKRIFLLILYTLFAIYFLNYPFEFIEVSESLSALDPWIIFVGGILLVIGGFNYFKKGRPAVY